MGFFSWQTSDSNESIANKYSSRFEKGTVYLIQPNGLPPIPESLYGGYGVFGGVNAYAWLAIWNGDAEAVKGLDLYEDVEELRILGVDLDFDPDSLLKFPLKFSRNKDAAYEQLAASKRCPYQGYFFPDH